MSTLDTLNTTYKRSGYKGVASKIFSHVKFKLNQRYRKRIRYIKKFPHKAYWYRSYPLDTKVIWINPDDVNYVVVPRFSLYLDFSTSHIIRGDWDVVKQNKKMTYASNYEGDFHKRGILPLEDYTFFQSMRAHFEDGKEWEETKFYRWIMENINKKIIRYESKKAVRKRLDELDEIFQSVKANGYISRVEAGDSHIHEIGLDIGRNGNFFLDEGRHRLCIAKILGIDSIPVRVFVRHYGWQEKRSKAARNECSNLNHPDLRDVVSD